MESPFKIMIFKKLPWTGQGAWNLELETNAGSHLPILAMCPPPAHQCSGLGCPQ
jgi:hypothetical protein